MALFAIGDTHLSLSANKPMDVFGGGWTGYVDKLSAGFRALVAPEDTVVIAGDVSWGMRSCCSRATMTTGGPRCPK